jgi:predicted AAA+ superfamily ATPase
MDINLTFNVEEQNAFLQLIDAAVKHLGLSAVDAAAHFKNKIISAQLAAKSEVDGQSA